MTVPAPVSDRPLRDLPKAHLHAHLDGSYPLTAVQRLARRRGLSFAVPDTFTDVWAFFDAYGTVPELVQTHEDLAELCRALVHQEAADGVRYLEPAVEPQLYAPRLGGASQVLRTVLAAFAEAAQDTATEVGANITVNTDQDLLLAEELAQLAAAWAGRGVTAFGTAGFVEPAGLGRFARPAATARAAGLPVVSHAGQTGGPDSVVEALDLLGATRISHGFRAAEDPELLARLAGQDVVCDVCPVSNAALGVVADLASHPVRKLLAAGVHVTLNADDGLWFSTSASAQYELARSSWGATDVDLARIAGAGALASGMSSDLRVRFTADVDAWLSATTTSDSTSKKTLQMSSSDLEGGGATC